MRFIGVIVVFLLLGYANFSLAGPACDRVEKKVSDIPFGHYVVQFFSYNCEGDVSLYKDEKEKLAKITDQQGTIVADKIGGWTLSDNWYPPNDIKLVDMPDDFPFIVFHSSNYSPAKTSHSYILYSVSPTLVKIAEVASPVNEWQVLDHNGSEDVVVGFYKTEKNDYHIDRLVADGNEAKCNSCQGYDIEVLQLIEDGLVVVDRHPYEFEKEQKRYKSLRLTGR